jgi:hypothetical protein
LENVKEQILLGDLDIDEQVLLFIMTATVIASITATTTSLIMMTAF